MNNRQKGTLRSKMIRQELKNRALLGLIGALITLFGFSVDGGTAIGLVGLGVLLLYLLPFFKGGYPKSFETEMTKNGVTAEQLEADIATGQSFPFATLGRRFLVVLAPKLALIPLRDIIWCYGINTTMHYRVYGIVPAGKGKSFSLKLVRRDRSETMITAGESDVQTLLREIKTRAPGVIIGYNQELDKNMKSHFEEAVRHVDQLNSGIL
ncbi:MAG: hypothetical protein IJW67_00955 [Blautia sp.]|nr:hypothetical protein [Blautia sp.]